MAKRNVKLILMNNNQIILGTYVSANGDSITLRDTATLQGGPDGTVGLAVHDLNGLVKERVEFSFLKTSITSVVDEENITDTLKAAYLSYATGVTVPEKPQILLQG